MTSSGHGSAAWFVRPRPRPDAALRLFCFSHAGGAASSYFPWSAALADVDVLAVQLPGREGRLSEPPIDDADALVGRLADVLSPWLDRPFVFFGHSMGAYLAFETARALRRRALPQPRRLIVSGRRAPTMAEGEAPLHALPDAELVAELNRRFGGLPAVILAEPELMALFLPIIRADLRLLERAVFRPEPPLALPISAFGGADDARADLAAMTGWRDLTAGGFDARKFPGGHFYLHERRDDFLPTLASVLASERAGLPQRADAV